MEEQLQHELDGDSKELHNQQLAQNKGVNMHPEATLNKTDHGNDVVKEPQLEQASSDTPPTAVNDLSKQFLENIKVSFCRRN